MRPSEEIENLVKENRYKFNSETREKVFNNVLQEIEKNETQKTGAQTPDLWRIIMKSPLTKLAAVIVFAVCLIYFSLLPAQYAWANVIKAFNDANNVHVTTKITRPDGKIEVENTWLKNKKMFRGEEVEGKITIDDGNNCLILDVVNKTAHFSDSNSPFMKDRSNGPFSIILLFTGNAQPYLLEDITDDYKPVELPAEKTDTERVFKIAFYDFWIGKAWIDAKSNLPKYVIFTPTEKYKQSAIKGEIIFDYQTIPIDKFSFTIPQEYKMLP